MNRTVIGLVMMVAVAGCLAGCGSSTVISGNVTYEGQPVEKGSITFLPADGKGPAAGGQITNGVIV